MSDLYLPVTVIMDITWSYMLMGHISSQVCCKRHMSLFLSVLWERTHRYMYRSDPYIWTASYEQKVWPISTKLLSGATTFFSKRNFSSLRVFLNTVSSLKPLWNMFCVRFLMSKDAGPTHRGIFCSLQQFFMEEDVWSNDHHTVLFLYFTFLNLGPCQVTTPCQYCYICL